MCPVERTGAKRSGNRRLRVLRSSRGALDAKPEYLVCQGRALLEIAGKERAEIVDQVTKWAGQALELSSGSHAGAYGLLGNAHLVRSRGLAANAAGASALRESIQAYEQAIKPRDETDKYFHTYLEGCSMAHLELAHCLGEGDRMRDDFEKAVENAREATTIADRRRPENAYNALGNALEDMAYYLGEHENYGEAIDS